MFSSKRYHTCAVNSSVLEHTLLRVFHHFNTSMSLCDNFTDNSGRQLFVPCYCSHDGKFLQIWADRYEVGRLCTNKLLQSEKKIAEGFFFAKYFKTPFTVPSSEITSAVFLKIRHSSLIEHTQCKLIMRRLHFHQRTLTKPPAHRAASSQLLHLVFNLLQIWCFPE